MPSDQQIATELAGILMSQARSSGPLHAVRQLTRVLNILRIVIRVITYERNRHAYSLTCYRSHRRVADLVGVSASTMQRWMESGSPNGSTPLGSDSDNELTEDE